MTRALLRAAALALVVAAGLAAQQPVVPPQPTVGPATPFVAPKFTTHTLPNGLGVAIVENHSVPVVAVRVVMPGLDSTADPAGKEGLFALSYALLREGTTTLTAQQIADSMVVLGTDVQPTRFTTVTPRVDASLALMADMLLHPADAQASVDQVKSTMAAAAQAQLLGPYTLPNRIWYRTVFGASSPEARAVGASAASIGGLTRDDVMAFQRAEFRPDRTWIVVAGDVDDKIILSKIESLFGTWRAPAQPLAVVTSQPTVQPTTIYLLDRPGAPQSTVIVAQPGPPRTSADFSALEVLAAVLAGSSDARLLSNLREKHGYIYQGGPFAVGWRRPPQASLVRGFAQPFTPKTDSAMIEWLRELRDIRGARPPSPSEVAAAKSLLVDRIPALFETDDRIADQTVSAVSNGLDASYYTRYPANILATTDAQVAAAAAKYIDPDHLTIVIAGDRKVIEPALRAANLAPVVVVDADGKPVAGSPP